nr:MAG TPA: hypothetical protein [Caudoviricetes sp.]
MFISYYFVLSFFTFWNNLSILTAFNASECFLFLVLASIFNK